MAAPQSKILANKKKDQSAQLHDYFQLSVKILVYFTLSQYHQQLGTTTKVIFQTTPKMHKSLKDHTSRASR